MATFNLGVQFTSSETAVLSLNTSGAISDTLVYTVPSGHYAKVQIKSYSYWDVFNIEIRKFYPSTGSTHIISNERINTQKSLVNLGGNQEGTLDLLEPFSGDLSFFDEDTTFFVSGNGGSANPTTLQLQVYLFKKP